MHRTAIACTTVATLGLLAAAIALGPLNPPGGPVSPSYKTLAEIEPRIAINAANTPGDANSSFRITQPGSYYLTGNITGGVGRNGIEIAASNVTIDLMGYTLTGNALSADGITTDGLRDNIVIRNGTVSGWGSDGINLIAGGFGNGSTIENITAAGNGNASSGYGIFANSKAVVRGCTALNNYTGIQTGSGSTLSHCTASDNVLFGIKTGSASTVSDCVATNTTSGTGFSGGFGSVLINCSSSLNETGFFADSGTSLSNCSAYDNSGPGFNAFSDNTISNCSALGNGTTGIGAGSGSVVEGCSASSNGGNGLSCFRDCVIRGNTLANNGSSGTGANIRVTGSANRIEANNCSGAERGIHITAADNVIVRNTCRGATTNWEIIAGNKCLVVVAVSAGAITGNSGGAGPGSTDPNANFTY